MRYEVEIQAPLSTPVPMPPSMLRSEAFVIWMFRIAMNAPIMLAKTAIQEVRLALSDGAAGAGMERTEGSVTWAVVVDMASLLREFGPAQLLRSDAEAMRVASPLVSMVG